MSAQQASQATSKKFCFVIAPIGESGDSVRTRSDQVFKYIIAPAATACGYEPLRADQIPKPGIITSQVIQHLIDDPLVIADLTGPNANVFYELAIRHAFRKAVVQIIDAAQAIPFDLAASRTVKFDYRDLDSVDAARKEIERHIKAVEENPEEVDNPLTQAVDVQSLRRSDKPVEKSIGDIMAILQDLQTGLNEIQRNTKRDVFFVNPSVAGEDFTNWVSTGDVLKVNPAANFRLYLDKLKPTNPPETGKDNKGK